jgi:hypothetical protein
VVPQAVAALVIHVLISIYWAGTTFTPTRLARLSDEKLVFPQVGAAAIAVLSGGYLGHALHGSSFGLTEQIGKAQLGAAAALLAVTVIAMVLVHYV